MRRFGGNWDIEQTFSILTRCGLAFGPLVFCGNRQDKQGDWQRDTDTPIATNSLALGRLLTRHARYRPSHTAVVIGNERLTYLQFNDLVNRWANALAALGAGTVPLSPLFLAAGFLSLLNDAKPRVILSTKTLCGILDEVRPQLAYR